MTQARAGARVALSQQRWSDLELGRGAGAPLLVWAAAAAAVGEQLVAFMERTSGVELPRDIQHLRRQEAVIRVATPGGWAARPEAPVVAGDRPRSIDLLLTRAGRREAVVVEIWDLLTDVGAALRTTDAKQAAVGERLPGWRVSACWVVRGTRRNRNLVRSIPHVVASRFPDPGTAWLAALRDPGEPLPRGHGLLWTAGADDGLRLADRAARRPRGADQSAMNPTAR